MSSLDPPSPPSVSDELRLDFPAEHVLLLTLNRPWAHNAMTPTMAHDLRRVLNWFEGEPRLWWVRCLPWRNFTRPNDDAMPLAAALFSSTLSTDILITLSVSFQGCRSYRCRASLLCRR